MSTQLAFHETQFNVVNHNNQIWLTAVEIAKALRYKSDDSVTKIYNRNHEEFSPGMSETVNLTASGNYQKTVRVFSLRGAHLIAMFARTPVAKEFRRWVLDVLDREVGEPVSSTNPAKSVQIAPPGRYRLLLTMEGTQVIDTELVSPEKVIIFANDAIELVMRAGYVLMPCDEVGKVTMDEWREMAGKARKLRDHWNEKYARLEKKYF
ncbi:hypothetical protein E1630_08640 [Salmonella enterica subsp. enterica serovar Baguida]|nr:hypothetical protein [Salmonella enterica subsp. enterica serovar Baguida]